MDMVSIISMGFTMVMGSTICTGSSMSMGSTMGKETTMGRGALWVGGPPWLHIKSSKLVPWEHRKMTDKQKEEEEGENIESITYGFAVGKK